MRESQWEALCLRISQHYIMEQDWIHHILNLAKTGCSKYHKSHINAHRRLWQCTVFLLVWLCVCVTVCVCVTRDVTLMHQKIVTVYCIYSCVSVCVRERDVCVCVCVTRDVTLMHQKIVTVYCVYSCVSVWVCVRERDVCVWLEMLH